MNIELWALINSKSFTFYFRRFDRKELDKILAEGSELQKQGVTTGEETTVVSPSLNPTNQWETHPSTKMTEKPAEIRNVNYIAKDQKAMNYLFIGCLATLLLMQLIHFLCFGLFRRSVLRRFARTRSDSYTALNRHNFRPILRFIE